MSNGIKTDSATDKIHTSICVLLDLAVYATAEQCGIYDHPSLTADNIAEMRAAIEWASEVVDGFESG